MQLRLWAKQDGTGVTFDSSTGFVLPDRSVRSPDGAWVARWRYDALTESQKDRFLPLCPEFVIELKSPSDYLPSLQQKMEAYIENGHAPRLVDCARAKDGSNLPSATIC